MLRQPWNHTLFLHIGTASNIDNQISQILPVPVGNSRWIMQMQKENEYPRIRPAFLCSARLQLAVECYHSTHGKQHAYVSAPVKKFRNNIYILKGNGGKQERLLYSMLHKIRELLKNLFRIDLATHQALLPSKLWMSFPAIPAERSGTPATLTCLRSQASSQRRASSPPSVTRTDLQEWIKRPFNFSPKPRSCIHIT